jgi:hypothetical protein
MSDEFREETGYALTLFPTNCSPHHSLLITRYLLLPAATQCFVQLDQRQ